jgi:hypothetical protein
VRPLEVQGPNATRANWDATPELKAHCYVLYPLLKMGPGKAFGDILKELKTCAENQVQGPVTD